MNADTVDGYRTAGNHLPPIADWFINLVAQYGIWTVIGVGTAAIVAVMCAIGAGCQLIRWHRQRRADERAIRQLELFANDPDNHRKETP
ncbi:hypothetical protein [Streptomyces sp. NPDC060027]|uniref:hypothetical protein n=1 Tax=Streptomyces sp. NPDC060027 TaxID=3347040 RepID=UPI0036ABBB6F